MRSHLAKTRVLGIILLSMVLLWIFQENWRWYIEWGAYQTAIVAHCGWGTRIAALNTISYAYSAERFNEDANENPIDKSWEHVKDKMVALDDRTWKDFVARNWHPSWMALDVGLSHHPLLVEFLAANSPRKCGNLTLSRAGLNPLGTQALIYIDEQCPGWCGVGKLYLLEKQGFWWQVVGESIVWVS